METKEFKINVPEGYEIDKENSTFECIKFKCIEEEIRFRDDTDITIKGYSLSGGRTSYWEHLSNVFDNYDTFATEKQAKSAIAMARISQIMANDKRFGGVVTDEEWKNDMIAKNTIVRKNNNYSVDSAYMRYSFLAFHTQEQRELFIKENMDLIKDYLMID